MYFLQTWSNIAHIEKYTFLALVDCVVGNWSTWGDCSQSCGEGLQERGREILVQSDYNGIACPSDLAEMQFCIIEDCPEGKKCIELIRFLIFKYQRLHLSLRYSGGPVTVKNLQQRMFCQMKQSSVTPNGQTSGLQRRGKQMDKDL